MTIFIDECVEDILNRSRILFNTLVDSAGPSPEKGINLLMSQNYTNLADIVYRLENVQLDRLIFKNIWSDLKRTLVYLLRVHLRKSWSRQITFLPKPFNLNLTNFLILSERSEIFLKLDEPACVRKNTNVNKHSRSYNLNIYWVGK